MKYQDLTPEARIQFARTIVMVGEEFGKKITMDDAAQWLSNNGSFVLRKNEDGTQDMVLVPTALDELRKYFEHK